MGRRRPRYGANRKRYVKKKRRFKNDREQDKVYCRWRDDVKDRDSNCCQWPNCGSEKRLQVHHIKTWSSYPGLRFVVANGITLCEKCHKTIKGKEADFEAFFLKLLEYKMLNKLKQNHRKL